MNENPTATDREKRVLIADVVAENSRPKYIEDVRQRKRTVATGDGEVHRARYALRDWGIDAYSWKQSAQSEPESLTIIQ